jgi:hypothetical protein
MQGERRFEVLRIIHEWSISNEQIKMNDNKKPKWLVKNH